MAAKSRVPQRKKPRLATGADCDIEDTPTFTASETQQIRKDLLAWYDAKHRCLPWRLNLHSLHQELSDPACAELQTLSVQKFMYRVWVSEMMLQQTQVSRASTYYQRWVSKWPTVQALAAADMQQVNEMWAGLGYYRRARYLFDSAKYVADHLRGQLPLSSVELQRIPGIGAYTSAAMASIAAGERVAAVDANVVRVLSRLRCLTADPAAKASKLLHARLGDMLVDPDRPGDFNQAMMELGAVTCTGNSEPACAVCPIQKQCQAFGQQQAFLQSGGSMLSPDAPLVSQYPIKAEKAAKKLSQRLVCVVKLLHPATKARAAETLYLLVKRGEKGLLAGLWEFPAQDVAAQGSEAHDRAVMDAYLKQELGVRFPDGDRLKVKQRRHLGQVSHEFSHISSTMHVDMLVLQGPVPFCTSEQVPADGRPIMRWVSQSALAAEGLSSRERKICTLMEL